MSNEIDKKELVEFMEEWKTKVMFMRRSNWTKEDEWARNQIVALIGASIEVTKPCPESSTVDKDELNPDNFLTKDELIDKAMREGGWRKLELALERNERLKTQVKELRKDLKYALSKIGANREVTEEWIEKWSEEMANYWEGQEDDYFVKDIKRMLKEIGVGVKNNV